MKKSLSKPCLSIIDCWRECSSWLSLSAPQSSLKSRCSLLSLFWADKNKTPKQCRWLCCRLCKWSLCCGVISTFLQWNKVEGKIQFILDSTYMYCNFFLLSHPETKSPVWCRVWDACIFHLSLLKKGLLMLLQSCQFCQHWTCTSRLWEHCNILEEAGRSFTYVKLTLQQFRNNPWWVKALRSKLCKKKYTNINKMRFKYQK